MGSRFRHNCRNKRRRYAKIVALVLVLILVCLLSPAQSVLYVEDRGETLDGRVAQLAEQLTLNQVRAHFLPL